MSFKINEELKIRSEKKLRDALHDIVTKLEEDEFFDLGTISNILRHEYNIFLTPKLLERLLTLWKDNKDSILLEDDSVWLKWDNENKIVENNLKKVKRVGKLGKSRRRLKRKEEQEIYDKIIKKDGWIRLRNGNFVYNGPKVELTKNDKVTISRFEKEKYQKGDNPIVPELVRRVFVLDHPNDADEIAFEIGVAIDNDKIKSNPSNGKRYYFECFKMMKEIAENRKLDFKRGWQQKYAPSYIKERWLKKDKQEKLEKDLEKKASKLLIKDKENALQELKNVINKNKKYYVLVTKYNKTKNKFYIKKLLFGYFTISDEQYPDGYYKIVLRNEKNGEDIIFFSTFVHLNKCIADGLKGEEGHVYNIFNDNELNKLKIYYNELKKYKGWDEFIDDELTNKLKADF